MSYTHFVVPVQGCMITLFDLGTCLFLELEEHGFFLDRTFVLILALSREREKIKNKEVLYVGYVRRLS